MRATFQGDGAERLDSISVLRGVAVHSMQTDFSSVEEEPGNHAGGPEP